MARPHPAGTLPIAEWTDDEVAQRVAFLRRTIETARHAGDVKTARDGLAHCLAEQTRRRQELALALARENGAVFAGRNGRRGSVVQVNIATLRALESAGKLELTVGPDGGTMGLIKNVAQ